MTLSRRLHRIEVELRARNAAAREKIVCQVPYWEDPDEYLEQMIASGEITEAQRGDVVLIHRIIVRPIHKFNEKGEIVGVIGNEVVPLRNCGAKSSVPNRRSHTHNMKATTADNSYTGKGGSFSSPSKGWSFGGG